MRQLRHARYGWACRFCVLRARCRQKAYRRRTAARAADPVAELRAAMGPFVVALKPGASQALHKALYRLQVAHVRGHDQSAAVARLASMDPERVKVPASDEGRRLRAALRGIHAP
ncbi:MULTISPECIES: hypothetical protein [unclassified Streptomyces]|uniref:hypothetical protein n=1 Tax=unclassified Streptomyces TaxID=2593676 RepID=UPI00380F0261